MPFADHTMRKRLSSTHCWSNREKWSH